MSSDLTNMLFCAILHCMKLKETYEIKLIEKSIAKDFYSRFHYLGNKGFRNKFSFGLYERETGHLVGCITLHGISAPETCVGAFGLKRTEQEGLYEIGRLAIHSDYNGDNLGSFFIWSAIKELKRLDNLKALITYADSTFHYGAVYQASNFKYYGLSTKKSDFYVNGKIQERGKTKGVDGVWKPRPQKHRYAYVFDKKLSIKWKEQPYPKEK